jgi:hypothetical protein
LIRKKICLNKKKTCGIFTINSSCGIYLSFVEMMRKEGTKLVLKAIQEYFKLTKNEIAFCIYDNACKLSETFKMHNNIKELDSIKFYIDRLHLANHKKESCHTNFNINNCKDLDKINSEVCEQNFFILNHCKHISKQMNNFHYNFFYLCHFDDLNTKKLEIIKEKT